MARKKRSDMWNPGSDVVNEIIKQYSDGMSARQLSFKYGVADVTITGLLKKKGVFIRNRSNAKRTNQINETIFDDIKMEEQFYWFGFILADGNIYYPPKRSKQLNFGLKESDWEHLEKFKKFIGSDKKLYYNNKAVFISFYSNRIVNALERCGITPRKSLTAKVPEFCKNNRHFWRGMVDGDGWMGLNKDGYPFIGLCGTESVINTFLDFTGIRVAIDNRNKNCQQVSYGWSTAKVVSKMLYEYSHVVLDRKLRSYLLVQNWAL